MTDECDEHTNTSRSQSTMGGSNKRRGISAVIAARGAATTADDDDRPVQRRSSEWIKAVFLFFYLFIAGVSNWAVIAYTHDFVPREPLPDVIFSLVEEQRWASSLGDFCVALCIVLLAALLVIHQHRGTILKRVVFCAATLYAMRSITLAVTQLPSAYTENASRCRDRVTPRFSVFLSRLIEQTIRIGFQSKDSMLCGDLLFSGHSLVMVTCSLAIAYYLPRSIKPLQWIAHISCAIGMICMIISRTHYTIDVIIAYWLSNMVFRLYHAFCELDVCMERQKSILNSWWPCRIIDWLEENIVPGRLENRVQWPLAAWRRRRENSNELRNSGSSSESSTCETSHNHQTHHKHVSIYFLANFLGYLWNSLVWLTL
uniref:PAP2_C domain-containing protein n=1 Tax=Caenorhabditis japonica TaxID=281687 RepID=A0A8R1E303_CAEJA